MFCTKIPFKSSRVLLPVFIFIPSSNFANGSTTKLTNNLNFSFLFLIFCYVRVYCPSITYDYSHIINIARLILQHTLKKLKHGVLTLIVMETNGLHIFYFLWTKNENYVRVITVEWTNLGIESNQINLTMNNAGSLFNFFQSWYVFSFLNLLQ